jgi:DNA-binding NarL/FixJ family response regulator
MEKITILIADDHQLIRDTWAYLLNDNPKFAVVAVAGTGEQAIEMARATKPDVALIDINMGDTNGFDVTREIRRFAPATKVIGVSIHSFPAYVKRMFQMGGSGYVTKNSSKEEFFCAIEEVYNRKHYVCSEIKNIVAMQELEPESQKPDIRLLSKRELEVVGCIRDGLSSKEIAVQLDVSLKTVEVHRHNILKKLVLPNTASLVNFVNHNGL